MAQIQSFVGWDDFEAPDNWVKLTRDVFYLWDGPGADAVPVNYGSVTWNLLTNVENGGVVAGNPGVLYNQYFNLSRFDKLVLRGKNMGTARILANRLADHGEWKEIDVAFNDSDPYWDEEYQAIIIPLDDFRNKLTSSNNQRVDDFVHLQAIKANWGSTVNVQGIYLIPYYVRGDANGDGIVNGTDIQAVINFIVAGEYDESADVNEDGVVNGTDIQEIINIIVNH